MKTILFTLVLLAATGGFLGAAENPFEKADDDLYTGRFKGQDVSLSLKPDGGKWSGSLVFKGSSYTIQGQQKDGRLQGDFSDSNGDYPFTLLPESGKLNFSAGSFTASLQRQQPLRLTGVYQSDRVKLDFKNTDGGINGTIVFKGQQYDFSAKDVVGTLEGIFKSTDTSFPFTLRVDEVSLLFKTGSFAEVLRSQLSLFDEEVRGICADANKQLKTLSCLLEGDTSGESDECRFYGTANGTNYQSTKFAFLPSGKLKVTAYIYNIQSDRVTKMEVSLNPQDILWGKREPREEKTLKPSWIIPLVNEVVCVPDEDIKRQIKTKFIGFFLEQDEVEKIEVVITKAVTKIVTLRNVLTAGEPPLSSSSEMPARPAQPAKGASGRAQSTETPVAGQAPITAELKALPTGEKSYSVKRKNGEQISEPSTITVRYASAYPNGISFKLDGHSFTITPGQTVQLQVSNATTLYIRECVASDCRWDPYAVAPGERYKIIDLAKKWDLSLVKDR